MSLHICGQCVYFQRESHPDDDEQVGECYALPPQILLLEANVQGFRPWLDPADRACALFREDRR